MVVLVQLGHTIAITMACGCASSNLDILSLLLWLVVVLVQLGHTIVITMACGCASSTWTYYSYYYGLWLC